MNENEEPKKICAIKFTAICYAVSMLLVFITAFTFGLINGEGDLIFIAVTSLVLIPMMGSGMIFGIFIVVTNPSFYLIIPGDLDTIGGILLACICLYLGIRNREKKWAYPIMVSGFLSWGLIGLFVLSDLA